MSIERMIFIGLAVVVGLIMLAIIYKYLPKRLKQDAFDENWKQLQAFCKDKVTWPDALIAADRLLDNALKRRKFKGKTMGERMVSAQRLFLNNDAVWFAHSLTKKILADPEFRLKEADVKSALIGFRQALRDLGALPNGEPRDT
jgi:hypothetical protein